MAERIEMDLARFFAEIRGHLLPPRHKVEEAAFAFAERVREGDLLFRAVEWHAVPPEGFVSRSAYHMELTDETRAHAIKRAHDLGASLVELHSHLWPAPPRFSPTDQDGFHEFVPHVWWRLKAKPYFAIVLSVGGFDGLAWTDNPLSPFRLNGLLTGDGLLEPTPISTNISTSYDDE
jgi:hypothetical protein